MVQNEGVLHTAIAQGFLYGPSVWLAKGRVHLAARRFPKHTSLVELLFDTHESIYACRS